MYNVHCIIVHNEAPDRSPTTYSVHLLEFINLPKAALSNSKFFFFLLKVGGRILSDEAPTGKPMKEVKWYLIEELHEITDEKYIILVYLF